MINIFEKQFEKLADKIKLRWKNLTSRFVAYIKRLLFPLYLFPIKLLTYTAYYVVKLLIKTVFALIKIIFECIIFPFKSLKNLLKSIFVIILVIYLFASLFVIVDYLTNQYGVWSKFFCSFGVYPKLRSSVVRVVGGNGEGSGFFIAENQVLTNFHVIADEPTPKIIFPDGKFTTPVKIIGNKDADLALLFTEENYPDLVLPLQDDSLLYANEPLISAGYPLGTDLSGSATIVKGNFNEVRSSKSLSTRYIQTDVSLVGGMSGGPLTDQCGQVVGINTSSLAGLSLFILGSDAKKLVPEFSDQNVTKINVDPSASPEEAVRAYYTYLKARRMKEGFGLLSQEYLQKTNFEEWTARFTNILDVEIYKSEKYENTKDTAFVKFATKNWVDGEAEWHDYEGTWKTVKEDGVYKMLKSKILEVQNPGTEWFYE